MIYLYERESDVYEYNQLGQSAAQLPVTHPSPQKKHTVPKGERTNAVKKTNATAAAKKKTLFCHLIVFEICGN